MSKIFKSVILLGYSIFLSVTASAQINGVNVGDSVRVATQSAPGIQITGIVTSLTPRIIAISEGYTQYRLLEIPIETIEKLEIQKEVRNTGRGALIGAGVGGVILGFIAMASNESCDPDEWCLMEFSDGEVFLMGTAIGLLPGALVGAVIGANIKTKKWKKVPFEITTEPISLSYLNKPLSPGITLKWTF